MDLTVQKREQFGRAVKGVRKQGLIPAELYGKGVENVHLSVSSREFTKVFKQAGESTMINLIVDGKKRPVMIHEVSHHPITGDVLGIDFYQVRLDEKLQIKVPINYMGEAPAVKEKQGVLVKAVSEIKIEALPTDIPKAIDVDLAMLKDIGQSISLKDLTVPAEVKVLDDLNTVIATVTARMTEEEEAKLAAAADVSAIKSEVEEKKEQRAEKAAAEGEAPAAGSPGTPPAEAKK